MTKIDQVFLTFVLNAFWQIAIIAAVAGLCSWLLGKGSVRYKHILWVTTLVAAFSLPVVTCVRLANLGALSGEPRELASSVENTPEPVEASFSSAVPIAKAVDEPIRV